MKNEDELIIKSDTITVWVKQGLVVLINKIAAKAGISRNKLIKNMIVTGLEELKNQDEIGIIKLNIMITEYNNKLKALIASMNINGTHKEKSTNTKGMTVTVRLDKEVIDEIDRWAEIIHMTRSKFVQHIFDVSIGDLKKLNAMKLVDIFLLVENLKDTWKNAFKQTEISMRNKTIKFND